jgi:GWxTD domain-containing protein
MIRYFIRVLGFIYVFLPLAYSSQTIIPKLALDINVDYSRFYYSETEGCLEIYYSVYPSLVTLNNESGIFQGAVEIHTVIRNKLNDTLMLDHQAALSVVVPDTSNEAYRKPFVAKVSIALPFGTYSMEVFGKDKQNRKRKASAKLIIQITSLTSSPAISDIDLCSNISSSTNVKDPFYKNTYEVVPNPSLFFGLTVSPVVFSYVELYHLDTSKAYTIKTQILDSKNTVILEKSRNRSFRVKNAVDVGTLKITTINSGKYKFSLALSDESGKEIIHTEKSIYIYNPNVSTHFDYLMSAKSAELMGMTDDELISEFTKARYIALDQEIRTFEKISSVSGHREFLAKFWADVERRTAGLTDLTRNVYLQRILTANERYRIYTKEGWKTDRGRVYMLYAEPDEIERFPSVDNSKPYEIWHYNQMEGSVVFIFIDNSGFGNYLLVHSTKRGELQDENWQEYLK